ncbi:succinylglutamate desuccinylase/aspartoacylase family protein [Kordiimonas lacus]|uniref:Succinylglutamate desuccinylase/Aspartoacylase catalytic domain-containing protein n=1 Tax=Kordiimonas lacus TaxID=637679 RepID=A0A1G6XN48_9PROT|nr:succinylglutamate desuccinylase/aspartoacylase family protein [Kordiimonas lacus]SDD79600.1 hypothetical protein SAMN04488071_1298 [Kordiimonas lacus]
MTPFLRLIASLMIALGAAQAAHACMTAPVEETGDRVAGVPVITGLDAARLPQGRHDFYFRAGWRNTGEPIHVPVVVVRGAQPGKTLLLTAAVHGDELNGIAVLHRLLEGLNAETLSGTVVAVPGLNQPGINANNRRFPVSSGGGALVDLNRNFPGTDEVGGSTSGRYIGALWGGLLRPNADFAVDIHTQTRGAAYPLFVFADFGNAKARAAAHMLGPDMIKNDAGQQGTLETSLMKEGIPAVTLEVGAPKQFQPELIDRAVWGIMNLMRHEGLLAGDAEAPPVKAIVGSNYTNIYADRGGIAVLHVGLKDVVTKGQKVATLYDAFGHVIRTYKAPHNGWVLAISTDPVREAGSMLLRILQ